MEATIRETKDVQINNEGYVKLTKDLLNQYRDYLTSRGCGKQTISMYFCYLNRLYVFLHGNRELTDENIRRWMVSLKENGYSDRTINMHISAVNGLMRFCGHRNVTVSVITVARNTDLPGLSREEYLKLLSYTKKNGSERDYILIKTLTTIDITVVDLSLVTVEACQAGIVEFPNNREVIIPKSLQQELLSYIKESGLKKGSIFITSKGNQMDRSNITHDISRLGKRAGLDPDKCNPRSLHHLYQRTQEEIDKELISQHMQIYEDLLDTELSKVS